MRRSLDVTPTRLQEASRTSRHIDAALWGASLAIMVAILVFSWATEPPLASFSYTDKIGHALAYAALTGALLLAAVWRPGRGDGSSPRATWAVLAAATALGGLAEIGQGLFFHRDASVRDFLIDVGGVFTAWIAWMLVRRMRWGPPGGAEPA